MLPVSSGSLPQCLFYSPVHIVWEPQHRFIFSYSRPGYDGDGDAEKDSGGGSDPAPKQAPGLEDRRSAATSALPAASATCSAVLAILVVIDRQWLDFTKSTTFVDLVDLVSLVCCGQKLQNLPKAQKAQNP